MRQRRASAFLDAPLRAYAGCEHIDPILPNASRGESNSLAVLICQRREKMPQFLIQLRLARHRLADFCPEHLPVSATQPNDGHFDRGFGGVEASRNRCITRVIAVP